MLAICSFLLWSLSSLILNSSVKGTAGKLASCSPNAQQEQRSASPQGTSLGLYAGKLTVYAANICRTGAVS